MATTFHPGQRWISESEPELGLGEVHRVGTRTVTLAFGASEEVREYVLKGAPLRRVAFKTGDRITSAEGDTLTVDAVLERDALFYYACGALELCETGLSDALSFSGPQEKFFAARFDAPKVFDLRYSALKHQYRRRKSEVRGFVGGRIDLLPHQLSIAAEVTARLAPRVLLADEVGLGKTIEAGLILHRLLLTGRASRVLLLVPESLQHQWFLELLRRFNLWFHLYDEERCQALEDAEPGCNPFQDDQLVLCELGLFTRKPERLQQALAAGWDLLVVDEAHHLGWSPDSASAEYGAVEALCRAIPGLLLLTATPEQLGMASHFARLRLLDPDRFYDLGAFLQESETYRELAALAEALKSGRKLAGGEVKDLARLLGQNESTITVQLQQLDEATRGAWIERLLDQHGTGRVMFRNTRATVSGFPKRIVRLHPLAAPEPARAKALAKEWVADIDAEAEGGFTPSLNQDPRIQWLADLLHGLGQEKVLLICRTQRKAEAIEAALKQRLKLKMAVFHEGLSLVQRDRGAAWFADAAGARLLICSEIGSEGRNFQFAHHLVLFDLPLDPSLLEQRLGRLDRIGQSSDIQVHVPLVPGTPQEVLARWYHEGLDAFATNLQGGRELLERFGERVRALAQRPSAPALDELIAQTRAAKREVAERLEQGRDRLLEWNSFRPELSRRVIHEIQIQDGHKALEDFLLATFELFFVEVEEVAPRTYQVGSAGVLVDSFPGLSAEGLTLTCDRKRALMREDLQFLTWDHPLVTGALDLLLGSEQGCSTFARWPDDQESGLYLEAIYMLECVAPPALHLDRFLPPTPIRVMVDHKGRDAMEALPYLALSRLLKAGDGQAWMERPEIREALLPRLIQKAQSQANRKVGGLVAKARLEMNSRLEREVARLRELQQVNRSVRDQEIELIEQQQQALDGHLSGARLRLEALRLIHRGGCDNDLS